MSTTSADAPHLASSLAERCFEIPARVDRIVHLAVVGGEDMEDELCDWLCGDAGDTLAEQLPPGWLDEIVNAYGPYGERAAELRSALAETFARKPLLGWLVEVSTPSRRKSGGSYSWGSYVSGVFYADTYDAALEAGLVWAESRP